MFKPAARPESANNDTVIAAGVKVEGDFTSAGNIIIDGEVSGTLRTDMDLVVGPEAKITANVSARNARISGEVHGNLSVSERAELSATAKVSGDIQARILVMEAGAVLNGRCAMGAEAAPVLVPTPVLRNRPVKAES